MKNMQRFNGFIFERKKKSEMNDEERAKADAASAKAIATKGHEEVRKDQLAAVYLIAKNKHKTIGLGSVPQEEFAAYLDMKPNTYNHTIKKIENIIADMDGSKRKHANEGDVFKYAELVGKFVKMGSEELQDLAMQAVEGGKERAAKRSADEKKKKEQVRKSNASLVNAVADYVRAGVAAEKAVKAVAKAKGEKEDVVQAAWDSRMNESNAIIDESFSPKHSGAKEGTLAAMLDARLEDYVNDVAEQLKSAGCKSVKRSGEFGNVTFTFSYMGKNYTARLSGNGKSIYADEAPSASLNIPSFLKKLNK